ncbi:putative Dephospho-CoA kinase [Blattamonas nauphoetae]|uniref:Dephospho-CoA kinase n=1 Tax=Blattamonas nauphoetae TaxID=2049346 RepID=A0ABQ9XWN0_9EUKA|nr:putative Dephospho-CoA kinase [Blattamonas nauphoetae]
MIILGLTGGIATGKSTVSSLLQTQYPILDADAIVHDLYKPGRRGHKAIVKLFGTEILTADGEIDRPKLGELIFNNATLRKKLNSCIHRFVYEDLIIGVLKYYLKGTRCVVLDIPLLIELGWVSRLLCSKIACVHCEDSLQCQRLMARNSLTEEQARSRINSQLPLSVKMSKSDYLIDNNGSLESTKVQVAQLSDTLNSSLLARFRVLPPIPIALILLVILLLVVILRMIF